MVLARMPRSEFQWTKLEFTPLEWRYDQEPETIDLREGSEDAEGVDRRGARDGRPARRGRPQAAPAQAGPALTRSPTTRGRD